MHNNNSHPALDEIKARLKNEAAVVEGWLADGLRRPQTPKGLLAAMEYSLLAGGKRLRPVLCLTAARLFGLAAERVLPFACALECIHTYSLIHDDLPALDNDDLRRGRPTNHKQFDEATAILAGDGLLTDAFVFMAGLGRDSGPAAGPSGEPDSGPGLPAGRVLEALYLTAEAAGSSGMVGGQYLDIQYTGRPGVTLESLTAMHAMKTGAMLRAACECGAVLAGAPEEHRQALRSYGAEVGAAFQIADDILGEVGDAAALGKPVGRDAALHKNTYPALTGLENSRKMAAAHVERAVQALRPFTGESADLLRGLAAYTANRIS